MCTENYKILLKEMKGDLNKWKDITRIRKLDIVKMTILLKAKYRFYVIYPPISVVFLQKWKTPS